MEDNSSSECASGTLTLVAKPSTMCHFTELPFEILQTIMEYVEITEWSAMDIAFCTTNAIRSNFLGALKQMRTVIEEIGVNNRLKWIIKRKIWVLANFGRGNLNDNGVDALVTAGLSKVEILDVCHCTISNDGMKTILSNFLDLKALDISYAAYMKNAALRGIASSNLVNLKELHINFDRHTLFSDNGLAFIGCGNLVNLEILVITKCNDQVFTDDSITHWFTSGCTLTNLKVLDISYCHGITDKGLESIATGNLTNLETLHLSQCETITDAGIIAIGKGVVNGCLRNLRELYITIGRDNITDNAPEEVLKLVPHLEIKVYCPIVKKQILYQKKKENEKQTLGLQVHAMSE